MKKLARVFLVFSFAAAAMTALAGGLLVPSSIVVNEFGVGTYNGIPLASGPVADPANGGVLHLAYTLPFLAVPGGAFDIIIAEPGGQFSDILRFFPGLTGPSTTLFFYSDGADGLDAPADVPVLPVPIGGPPFLLETGLLAPGVPGPYSEAGPNGLVFPTGPGGFGSDGNPLGTVYTFVSDGVIPEPSTVTLVGLGVVGSLAIIRRRR